jgi:hypothetical protein
MLGMSGDILIDLIGGHGGSNVRHLDVIVGESAAVALSARPVATLAMPKATARMGVSRLTRKLLTRVDLGPCESFYLAEKSKQNPL